MELQLFNNITISTHNESDYISSVIKKYGIWEPNITYHILNLDCSGIFVDIGANIGYYSLIASKKYAQVYAFEPIPDNINKLHKSININKITNIMPIEKAISDIDDSILELTVFPTNMGGSRDIHDTINTSIKHMDQYKINNIHTITFDSFVKKYGINTIDLIKVDVEGAELHVLNGMKESFQNKCIKHIIIELSPNIIKVESCIKIINIFKNNNYNLYDIGLCESGPIIQSTIYKNITNIDSKQYVESVNRQTNILAHLKV